VRTATGDAEPCVNDCHDEAAGREPERPPEEALAEVEFPPDEVEHAPSSEIAEAVRAGLSARHKTLPPVLFYDRAGSALFERICRREEYYLARTGRAILDRHAPAIAAALPEEVTLVELGCGTAEKTEVLLRALGATRDRVRFVACDVSRAALALCTERLRRTLPDLEVVAVAGDFAAAMRAARDLVHGACAWVFLGSSLGNLDPDEAVEFLAGLRRAVPGQLVLGTDMVKDEAHLRAAYDDAAGVTAAFNRNVLHRINRELGADFVPSRFAHRARWDPVRRRVEMHLVSTRAQTVRVPALGMTVHFARGESIHTENSYKYTPDDLRALAAASGFTPQRAFTDERGWFTLSLWTAVTDGGAASGRAPVQGARSPAPHPASPRAHRPAR